MVQWLGLSTFTAVAPHSIPAQGTKIPKLHGCQKKNPEYLQKLPVNIILNGEKRAFSYG